MLSTFLRRWLDCSSTHTNGFAMMTSSRATARRAITSGATKRSGGERKPHFRESTRLAR